MPTTEELIEKLKALGENPQETRSRRMQVLVTPSLYDALKDLTDETKVSMNEIVNSALLEYLKGKE